jgi:hypothetical protein
MPRRLGWTQLECLRVIELYEAEQATCSRQASYPRCQERAANIRATVTGRLVFQACQAPDISLRPHLCDR